MTNSNINQEIKHLIGDGSKITFLVGAGISMDQPTGLPSARQICQDLFEFFGPYKNFEEFKSIKEVRYEMIIEKIQQLVDKNLSIMDYFEVGSYPNINHLFLAGCILKNMNVLTTNFDYSIETSLKSLLPKDQHARIKPIITQQDFETVDNSRRESALHLFKIHGSKKNIMTGQDTTDSLITTTTALGRNRTAGETFGLESFKKPLVSALLDDHLVVVMGYSGSDDFDITPAIRAASGMKRVIWIEHQGIDNIEVTPIRRQPDDGTSPHPLWNKLPASGHLEVTLVSARTSNFIRKVMLPLVLGDLIEKISSAEQDFISSRKSENIPDFHTWLSSKYKVPSPPFAIRFGAAIYYDARLLDRAFAQAKTGMHVTNQTLESPNLPVETRNKYQHLQYWFINLLGLISQAKEDFIGATQFFEEAGKAAVLFGDKLSQAAALNNLGTTLISISDFEKGIDALQSALKLDQERNDVSNVGVVLQNLGDAFRQAGRKQDAIKYLDEALSAVQQSGNLELKYKILNNLGIVFIELEQLDAAKRNFDDAIAIVNALGDIRGMEITKRNQENLKNILAKPPASRRIYIDAMFFEERRKRDKARAEFFWQKGRSIKITPDGIERMKILNEALDLAKKIKDSALIAKIDYDLGTGYLLRQIRDKAELSFLECLENCQQIHDLKMELEVRQNLGITYIADNAHLKALDQFDKALHIAETSDDKLTQASICQNLGEVYYSLKNKELAKNYLYRSYGIYSERKDTKEISKLDYWLKKVKALP